MPNVKTVTLEELTSLYASVNDDDAHHVLWVEVDGEIHVDPIPDNLTPVGFEKQLGGRMKFRWETWCIGNDFVGPDAARNQDYMKKQLKEVKADWAAGKTGYVDY